MENFIKKKFVDFLSNDSGATAIEYGLIASLIGISIIIGGKAMGDAVNSKFECTAELLESDDNTANCGD